MSPCASTAAHSCHEREEVCSRGWVEAVLAGVRARAVLSALSFPTEYFGRVQVGLPSLHLAPPEVLPHLAPPEVLPHLAPPEVLPHLAYQVFPTARWATQLFPCWKPCLAEGNPDPRLAPPARAHCPGATGWCSHSACRAYGAIALGRGPAAPVHILMSPECPDPGSHRVPTQGVDLWSCCVLLRNRCSSEHCSGGLCGRERHRNSRVRAHVLLTSQAGVR
jgi:hypothetical protein